DYHNPLLDPRGDDHYLVVLITSDKGLCGAFNTNAIKTAQHFIRDNPGKKIELVTIGRKGRDFFRRRPTPILKEYVNVTSCGLSHEDAAAIARDIMVLFAGEESTIDRVFLIYNEFKSVLSQPVVMKQLLPIGSDTFGGDEPQNKPAASNEVLIDYIYEQP